LDSVLVEIVIF